MGKDRYILTKNKKNLLSICVLPSLLKGFLSCMIKKRPAVWHSRETDVTLSGFT
jgi:hypothetical protein